MYHLIYSLKRKGIHNLTSVPFTFVFGSYNKDIRHIFTPRYSLLYTSDVRTRPSILRVCLRKYAHVPLSASHGGIKWLLGVGLLRVISQR